MAVEGLITETVRTILNEEIVCNLTTHDYTLMVLMMANRHRYNRVMINR